MKQGPKGWAPRKSQGPLKIGRTRTSTVRYNYAVEPYSASRIWYTIQKLKVLPMGELQWPRIDWRRWQC